jgi:hypothetical protein
MFLGWREENYFIVLFFLKCYLLTTNNDIDFFYLENIVLNF